jgi:hypothetical protein
MGRAGRETHAKHDILPFCVGHCEHGKSEFERGRGLNRRETELMAGGC